MRVFCCRKKDAEPKGSAKSPLPAERGIALNRCEKGGVAAFFAAKALVFAVNDRSKNFSDSLRGKRRNTF